MLSPYCRQFEIAKLDFPVLVIFSPQFAFHLPFSDRLPSNIIRKSTFNTSLRTRELRFNYLECYRRLICN